MRSLLQGKELCGAYLYVKFPDRALQGPHSGGAFLTKATIEATKLSSAVYSCQI